MKRTFDLRFWLWHGLLPLLLFAVLAGLFAVTDWDLRLSDPFYDPLLHAWTYKHSWWASGLIHTGGKYLVVVVGVAAVLVFFGSYVRGSWRRWRRMVV